MAENDMACVPAFVSPLNIIPPEVTEGAEIMYGESNVLRPPFCPNLMPKLVPVEFKVTVLLNWCPVPVCAR